MLVVIYYTIHYNAQNITLKTTRKSLGGFHSFSSQLAYTYLKLTTATLYQGVKYVPSQQQRHQNDGNGFVLVSLLLTLNIFHTLF